MINTLLKMVFGTRNERLIKQMRKVVATINAYEPTMQSLSDPELRAKTNEFKSRLAKGETLNQLLPEAFAVVREVSVRTLGMRHFDVQLIGGMVLHDGKIAEMRTGEGKTLMATLAAYLNALEEKSVHIVTVNDYLAKRDATWMGPIYEFLGLTVGVNLTNMSFDQKKIAYAADITYGTNNEFGFDYMRDNMAFRLEGRVQRGLNYAIVDEVDSILIDEARTPLIISGPADDSSELYAKINTLIPQLTQQLQKDGPGDYSVDEKTRQCTLTEAGHDHIEKILEAEGLLKQGVSLYDLANIGLMHHINSALRAHSIYKKDVDYIVDKDKNIVIVDEHTGRLMPGRRWSDGLHQAVEAKEGVPIKNENQTLASISFQNYFRLYTKLAGMTGTADTEAFEFHQIYGLEVVVIPTHKPVVREDKKDIVFLNAASKYKAIVQDIKTRHEKGQPILVGTTSIDSSEYLSKLLSKANIPHQVLNAKYHEKEAKIIAEAGRPGAVTIATNMAGRGTDIVLGGSLEAELLELKDATPEQIQAHKEDWKRRNQQVIAAGGLHLLGTERNEARRIDNQLRGRSGRQGDPGSSQYYLSLEDNLMRIFASDRMAAFMSKIGMEEDVPIENGLVTRSIASAQRKVEGHNFEIRKQLLQYDDVANDQRKVIYEQRRELMEAESVHDAILDIIPDVVNTVIDQYVPHDSLPELWDLPGLEEALPHEFNVSCDIQQWFKEDESFYEGPLRERVVEAVLKAYQEKETQIGESVLRQVEKTIMLQSLDIHWKEHLAAMDYLRQGIHLRGYAQKNPVQEFKREAFDMFKSMLESIKVDIITTLCTIQISQESQANQFAQQQFNPFARDNLKLQHAELAAVPAVGVDDDEPEFEEASVQTFIRDQPKVGRNDPCPCGSGKKFKVCHGKV